MEEREKLIILYDYYGELFNQQQKKYFEWYFFDNFSLGEIAEIVNKSRNSIHKGIKTVSNKLYKYEEILKLYEKNKKLTKIIAKIDNKDIKNKLEELL